jgi:hypothetical protein
MVESLAFCEYEAEKLSIIVTRIAAFSIVPIMIFAFY